MQSNKNKDTKKAQFQGQRGGAMKVGKPKKQILPAHAKAAAKNASAGATLGLKKAWKAK
jgi:hypothetical protein